MITVTGSLSGSMSWGYQSVEPGCGIDSIEGGVACGLKCNTRVLDFRVV